MAPRPGRGDVLRRAGRAQAHPGNRARSSSSPATTAPSGSPAAMARQCSTTHDQGHNVAAANGIRQALMSGAAERVLMVPGDCPLLDPKQLEVLIARPGRRALGVDRPRPPRHRHQRAAAHAARRVRRPRSARAAASATSTTRRPPSADPEVVEVASLALDVDTPEDLEPLQRRARRTARRRRTHPRHAQPAEPQSGLSDLAVASALEGIPEVRPGDDLAALIARGRAPHGGGTRAPATTWS